MSIKDEEGNEIVTLGSIHAAVFRFVLATWHVVRTVDNHELRITWLERSSGGGSGFVVMNWLELLKQYGVPTVAAAVLYADLRVAQSLNVDVSAIWWDVLSI